MIQVGTKLKSTRTGEIVEIVELLSGTKKIKCSNGSLKVLTDGTIARWYDEVKEEEVPANKPSVASSESSEKLNTKGNALADEFISYVKANGWEVHSVACKAYTSIKAAGRCICHFHLQRKKVKVEFKPSDVTDDNKKWLVKYPDNFRKTYSYYTEVFDSAHLNKVLGVLSELAKKETK